MVRAVHLSSVPGQWYTLRHIFSSDKAFENDFDIEEMIGMRSTAIALLPLLLLVQTPAAVAASISETASLPLTTEPYTESLTFGQFNSALGALDSISFSLTETVQGAVTVTNNDNVSQNTTTPVSVYLTLERPDLSTLVADTNNATFIQSNLGAHSSTVFSYLPSSTTGTADLNPLASSDLALFAGTGSVALPVIASAFGEPDGPQLASLDLDLQIAASATVTYDYAPLSAVPLPQSWIMLLSGLLGFGFISRRSICCALYLAA